MLPSEVFNHIVEDGGRVEWKETPLAIMETDEGCKMDSTVSLFAVFSVLVVCLVSWAALSTNLCQS